MQKVILISGGSEGLGYEIAKILAPKNTVVILAKNPEKLEIAAKELTCDFDACDVADYNQCETAVRNIIAKHQKIDCLINNAGIWIEGDLDNNDPQRIKEVIDVNTLGTINFSKAIIPVMKEQGSGLIINVISQAGLTHKEGRSVYYASKWAITGFTKSLQPELAKYNIKVTGLYPGGMKTKMFEKAGNVKDLANNLDPADVAKTVQFILSFDNTTTFPEVGIKNINN